LDTNLPKFQSESFIKSFLLFFIVIEILLSFIFYTDIKEQQEHIKENIFLQMKNYSYDFKNHKFDIDIEEKQNQVLYELKSNNKYFYIYTDIKNGQNSVLKIMYLKTYFDETITKIYDELILHFLILTLITFIISILFAFYSLYPLQKSYTILQEFMKDIIHDINTPICAIKLNLSLIDKQTEETIAITQGINTLEMLHKNIDNYLNHTHANIGQYNIKNIIYEQYNFFYTLYDNLNWDIQIKDEIISTDRYMLNRIIYNLLNNACKYNIPQGSISISYQNGILKIKNSSYGIKNPDKVFDRFYKESDRGLGIGLHIVSKLSKELNIKPSIQLDENRVVTVILVLL
jgi:two-component system OmpR family sensor kinase